MQEVLIPLSIFIVGLGASWYGSQVGGGGLVVVPFLIFLGIPVQTAIIVHQVAILGGNASSFTQYWKNKKICWKYAWPLLIAKLLGSWIGVNVFLDLDSEALTKVAGIALLLPLPLLFSQKAGLQSKQKPNWLVSIGVGLYFLLSIWVGIFSAGGGIIGMYILTFCLGLSLLQSTATLRMASLLGRVLVFAVLFKSGLIEWIYAFPLLFGYMIGSWLGAGHAIKKGNKMLRWLLVTVVVASSVKLLFF